MLYFEKIDTKRYLCVEKLPWTSPWAAPEQSPPLTFGTPDQIQKKSFKGQENGLLPTPPHTNSMSVISQLLLTRLWPNFKGRILGPCLKDANCHGDLCPGNICPGDICPYQQYFSCYWSNFDQTFWTQLLWTKMFLNKISLDPNFFRTQNFFRYWTPNIF